MQPSMKWEDLLNTNRFKEESQSKTAQRSTARSEFQRDYDRIVFSSAFRRLQDKTQVFPLAESDYIRTRLTHSLEVSSVGRSLGRIVGNKIIKDMAPDLDPCYTPDDFGAIVAAACLAHDIGNPPFGHSGEHAIAHWFKTSKFLDSRDLTNAQKEDFLKFEGNAQGFRVLTRLQNHYPEGGVQLTFATLATFLKYPRESIAFHTTDTDSKVIDTSKIDGDVGSNKFGVFQKDKEHLLEVAEAVKLNRRDPRCYWWSRHPLAYLVEAADDICYRVIDVEDGFKLNYLDFQTIHDLLNPLLKEPFSSTPKILSRHDRQNHVAHLRSLAIDNLVHQACDVFIRNYEEIMAGATRSDLMSQTRLAPHLKAIKATSIERLYKANSVLQIEITGFELIGELLESFVCSAFEKSKRAEKYTQILTEHSINYNENDSDYSKLLQVTDFIAGMTDTYAMEFYRKIKGIRLAGYPA